MPPPKTSPGDLPGRKLRVAAVQFEHTPNDKQANLRKVERFIEAEFQGPKGRGWLMRWLTSRAHDHGLFIIFSNGVGIDDDEIRSGNAMIIDPYGRILAETCRAADDMVVADLDPSLLKMNTGRQWLKARRPQLYGLLAQSTGIELDTREVRST
jgi:predicted amidohydrolase